MAKKDELQGAATVSFYFTCENHEQELSPCLKRALPVDFSIVALSTVESLYHPEPFKPDSGKGQRWVEFLSFSYL